MNLKPSAIENELNAVLHFLKFIKRTTRNLAVTDPVFNATLENILKDIDEVKILRICGKWRRFPDIGSILTCDIAVCKQKLHHYEAHCYSVSMTEPQFSVCII